MADLPEDRDLLAAELVLGLLEGEARGEAMRLRLSDPSFAAAVEAWGKRFEPLGEGFEEHPSPALWPAIQRRIGGIDVGHLRRALGRWRAGAIAGGALAASLAAVIAFRPAPAPIEIVRAPEQAAIAQLGSGEAPALLAASYDPGSGVLRIRVVRLPETRRVPELWLIPADGVPRSLGLVSAQGVTKVDVTDPNRALLKDGVTLAISLESPDGAPHTAPSTTPIATGKISTI